MNAITIPFLETENAYPNQCFINVPKQVAKHGGKEVFGWLVEPMDNIKGVMQHIAHSAWQDPDGKISEITPQISQTEHDYLLIINRKDNRFIPDEKAKPTAGDDGLRTTPGTRWLTDNPRHQKACECMNRSDKASCDHRVADSDYWLERANQHWRKHGREIPPAPMPKKW